ncbi:MAG TPA: ATP-binding cassette domain-containing protein [Chloroflexota bacterium]
MGPTWQARHPGRRVVWLSSGTVTLVNLISFGLLAWAASHGQLSLAALAVYTQAVLGANGYRAFDDANANLAFAAVTVPSLLQLERRLAAVRPAGLATRALPPDSPGQNIRFESVAFRYAGRSGDALVGLDLTIPAGRSLAIVGANGAGKTTLVKLLCHLYQPTEGRITVDGIDLSDLDVLAWRRQVAAIFQDFTQYHLSARDNVAFGAPALAADLARLREAAQKVGALDLIQALPRGWETVLSRQYAGGVDLSGGQWQRIALARALFAVEAGARVLILDEPTASLDVRAEAELYDRFLEITAGLTTILISHRFSTVRRADAIVVLAEGRVVEQGTHEELVALGGRYAEMFALQAARFVEGPHPLPLSAQERGRG